MKVVHYIPSIAFSSGGVGAYMQVLAKELGKLVELHVITHERESSLLLENCIIHKIPQFKFFKKKARKAYEQLLDEIRTVISRPKFDNLISKETRYYFFEMVYDVCQITDITVQADSPIRDIKDIYLLSMAESVPVDYIVSGDKDLLDLGKHVDIPILNYSEFITITKQTQL